MNSNFNSTKPDQHPTLCRNCAVPMVPNANGTLFRCEKCGLEWHKEGDDRWTAQKSVFADNGLK